MSIWARFILGLTALLFAALGAVQLLVFGAPFGVTAALDLRLAGYTGEDARVFLEVIGADGRDVFFGYFHWLDTAFPPLVAVSLVLLFRHFRAYRGNASAVLFALLPCAYLAADLIENYTLGTLQNAHGFDAAAAFASDMTILKYLLLGASVLALSGGVLMRKKERV